MKKIGYKKNQYFSFGRSIVLGILLFSPEIQAQDESAIRPIIEAGDLKKLDKADKYNSEAVALMEEVTRLETEMQSIKGNTSLSIKEIRKKTEAIESEVWQKHTQASSLFEKCNEIKFVLYKKYLDRFWKEHSGEESGYLNAKLLEEQASDVYFQATGYRIDAKKMNEGNSKIEKLSQANSLEQEAIRKQLSSLGECYRISVASAGTQVDVPLREKEPVIQEEVVQEPIVQEPVIQETTPLQVTAQPPVQVESEKAVTVSEAIPEPEEEVVLPEPDMVTFRVQIVASKIPLTREQLVQAYKGSYPVEEIQEGGWYKYQLNAGNSLKKAQELRLQCGVSGAFVVAYRGSVKITLKEATQP